jgi:hypothetical protein
MADGATSYDVSFGTTNPPPLKITNKTTASYTPVCECSEGSPTPLAFSTTYFWQVVARNGGTATTGPVWSFTTMADPNPPSSPFNPNPADGATGVSTTATLSWSGQNTTSYDIRFGTTNPPPLVATGVTATSFTPTTTAATTYFWQIVANNANGSTAGAIWSFTTEAPPPAAARSAPNPVDGPATAGTTAALDWSSADAMVALTTPMSHASGGDGAVTDTPAALVTDATHFWQIVAHNASATARGRAWVYTSARRHTQVS